MKTAPKTSLVSIVTPLFNEGENIALLYDRLCRQMEGANFAWEWVTVDDHSSDQTFALLSQIVAADPRLRVYRLARNSGSHLATICGLNRSRGDCAIVMAGDLQDNPQIIGELVAQWRLGFQTVWAVRKTRGKESLSNRLAAKLYYRIIRMLRIQSSLPVQGSDCFLLDRAILRALRHFKEAQLNLVTLVAWMGFRQTNIWYDKEDRAHGKSKWTLEKKIKLFIDTAASFSYQPIRWMSYLGVSVACLGFLYCALILFNSNGAPQGWASLMVVVLVLGGLTMTMLGILGEYLWRALEESRNRPQFLIETYLDQRQVAVHQPLLLSRTNEIL